MKFIKYILFVASIFLVAIILKKNILKSATYSRETLSYVISPIFIATTETKKGLKYFFSHFKDKSLLLDENKKLREKLKMREIVEIKYKECERQKKELENILSLRDKYPYRTESAKVIARTLNNWNKFVMINKGGKQGIRKGQAVVNNYGLIGRIYSVGKNTSFVLLITDIESCFGAKIWRTREAGIVRGKNNEGLIFEVFQNDADIKLRDMLVTSGLSESIPEGIVVGKVVKVIKSKMSTTAEIKPLSNLGVLENLVVIVDKGEEMPR